MKKVMFFTLALVLVLVYVFPALAFKIEGDKDQKFYLGGIFMTDIGVWDRSKELDNWGGGGKSDRTEFILDVPHHSRVRGTLENGNVGGYWEIRLGRDNISAHEQVDANSAVDKNNRLNYIEAAQIYAWYQFGNSKIMAGKMDGSFLAAVPYQNLGFENNNHVSGLGWGAVYDDRAAQVRFAQNVSKAFAWQISLVQTLVAEVGTGVTSNDSYAMLPRVDLKFTLNFGPVSLFPGGSWQNVKWQNLPGGFDDNLTVWFAQLPVRVKAGPFTGTFQVGYGKNLGTAGVFPLQNPNGAFFRDGSGKIHDTDCFNGFIDLAFAAGMVTPHVYFGYDSVKNSDRWTVGDDKQERMMYGIGANVKLHDSLFLVPEFTYYNYGKVPNNPNKPDAGKEWLAGVQFQFVF